MSLRLRPWTNKENSVGGMTLVEMMVVIVVFLLIIGAAFNVLASAQRSAAFSWAYGYALDTTRFTMARMGSELEVSGNKPSPAGAHYQMDADGMGVSFQVPVLPLAQNPSVAIVDANFDPQWGADGTVGYWIRYEAEPYDPPTTYAEASLDIDLNGDGDKADNFELVRIARFVQDAAVNPAVQTRTTLAGGYLATSPTWGGDIDGDGIDDPMFMVQAIGDRLGVSIRLIAGKVLGSSGGDYVLVDLDSNFSFKNYE